MYLCENENKHHNYLKIQFESMYCIFYNNIFELLQYFLHCPLYKAHECYNQFLQLYENYNACKKVHYIQKPITTFKKLIYPMVLRVLSSN